MRRLPESELTRIRALEKLHQEWREMLPALQQAQAQWREAQARLDVLRQYYFEGQWQKDMQADEAGLIPEDMPRGILAEDTLYNTFHDEYQLALDWVKLGADALSRR